MHHEAREDIENYARVNEVYHDQRTAKAFAKFHSGDLVKIKHHRQVPGARKLNANWYGPLEVLEEIKDDVYRLRFAGSKKDAQTFKINVHNMAPCVGEHHPTDGEEYEIDAILDHRYSDDGSPEFRVRFVGYSPKDDEWIAFRNLKAPDLLSEYERLIVFSHNPEEAERFRTAVAQATKGVIQPNAGGSNMGDQGSRPQKEEKSDSPLSIQRATSSVGERSHLISRRRRKKDRRNSRPKTIYQPRTLENTTASSRYSLRDRSTRKLTDRAVHLEDVMALEGAYVMLRLAPVSDVRAVQRPTSRRPR